MKKFLMAAAAGTLTGVVVTTQVAGPLLAQEAAKTTNVYEQLDLFGDIFERIRSQYVEEVDEADLIEAAINGMLTSLDPHSSYLSPDDAADMRVQTRGEFGGLGIEVTQEDGFVKVVSPIDGTPADEAGIESGDFITHVDNESVLGLTLDEAVDLMRGPVGSEIVITVVREGEVEPFDVSIIRDTIKLTAVRTRTEQDTVILRVTTFNDQTFKNLESGLKEQVEEAGGIDNIRGVVLDLRNNPGGLLTQAIRVSDAFLEKGEIVSTRGRNPEDGDRFNATPGDLAEGKPIVVLINGGSASAVRDRRRCAQGSSPGHRGRHQELRQGVSSDRDAAPRRWRDAPDHRAVLHAIGPARSRRLAYPPISSSNSRAAPPSQRTRMPKTNAASGPRPTCAGASTMTASAKTKSVRSKRINAPRRRGREAARG